MKKRYLFIIFLLIVAGFVIKTLVSANFFKTFNSTGNVNATSFPGPPGLEDITIDSQNGYAYISSHNRRNFESRGDIYLYKINDSTRTFINLTADFPKKDFRPHGISLFIENDSTKFLFVVCHGTGRNSVERFKIQGEKLVHLNTFGSTDFISPNDVHAVSPTAFYITNDHDDTQGFMRTVKDFLKIGTGSVVYFNGDNGKIVATGIPYANGIHTSKDGTKLFVASTSMNEVLVYNRLPDNTITKEMTYDAGVGVDNIELDDAGNLYIGAHAQLLKYLGHAKDSTKLSPTVLLKLTYDETNKKFAKKTIYTDDGSKLSGGSVAAPYTKANGKVVILAGSVFERKMLVVD